LYTGHQKQMDDELKVIPLSSFHFVAKGGTPIVIRPVSMSSHEGLTRMYLGLERGCFAGLPPYQDARCAQWVEKVLRDGVNLVALLLGEQVVGHVALFPINPSMCELLLVVDRPYQNQGIGTQLTRLAVEQAGRLGFTRVWLSVGFGNRHAQHVYLKCGFSVLSHEFNEELEMVLDLKPQFPKP
jgi:GNAT superfamily N-acetyltransferase